MIVQVCDALCGAGKTSASINMMNERRDDKFIFVTQYLSETERIKNACPGREFILPESDIEKGDTKLQDTNRLLRTGKNIATTHSLFVTFTDETKQLIEEKGYILILDEVVDILNMSDIRRNDVDILLRSKSIREDGNSIEWINNEYQEVDGGKFREEMLRAKSKNLHSFDDDYFFWSIPPELFSCFKEVYVLTYLFEAQSLRCFFDLHNIPYTLIGTHLYRMRGIIYIVYWVVFPLSALPKTNLVGGDSLLDVDDTLPRKFVCVVRHDTRAVLHKDSCNRS